MMRRRFPVLLTGSLGSVWSPGPAVTLAADRRRGSPMRFLASLDRLVRAQRILPFGQPHLERAALPAGTRGVDDADAARRCVPGRRSRAELYVHGGGEARDGGHLRHPARQPPTAAHVQSAVRAGGRSRRFRLHAVRRAAPSGLGPKSTVVETSRRSDDRREAKRSMGRRSGRSRTISRRLTRCRSRPRIWTASNTSITPSIERFAVRASPIYAELMTATDEAGAYKSYLSSEERFAVMKTLESKNLVVPVVGDFGGPRAIRAVGAYLKAHGAKVSTFYLSNVEQYLEQDRKWNTFCRNVASLPLDRSSTFIRSTNRGRGFGGFGPGFVSRLGAMVEETKNRAGEDRARLAAIVTCPTRPACARCWSRRRRTSRGRPISGRLRGPLSSTERLACSSGSTSVPIPPPTGSI